jgi:hypothetical protein
LPGASQKVRFKLSKQDLTYIGPDMKRIFEPGWFSFATGADSRVEPQARLELQ